MAARYRARTLQTSSAAQTRRLAEQIGRCARAGDVILLYGALGTGKTVFVQGLAKGLGAAERPTSPSFTIVHEYPGSPALRHIDLYRLEPSQVEEIGLEQYLGRDAVTAVEWAERLPDRLRKRGLHVEMRFGLRNSERRIRLSPGDARAARLLRAAATTVSR